MNPFWVRLTLSCGVACLTAAGTEFLFKRADNADRFDTNAEPLAMLKIAVNNVERRPGARLIWQPIKGGDPLYRGDAVRTASKSEGQVLLVKGGTTIGLEPNSLIIIEESEGKIALDLVNGGLFVKKTAAGADGGGKGDVPIIKAGKAKFELGSKAAEVSLSMNDKGQAQVAVTKGDVEVKSENKVVTLKEGSAGAVTSKGVTEEKVIEVTQPEANKTFTVIGNTQAKVEFKWKPLSADYTVTLETGNDREALAKTSVSAPGASGTLQHVLPAGSHFWRLAASKKDTPAATKSIVYRVVVAQLFPPEPVSPRAGEKFTAMEKESQSVSFNWVSKSFDRVKIEVAASADFAKPVVSETIQGRNELTADLAAGATWHWRVLGLREDGGTALSSPVWSFRVDKLAKLAAPSLTSPEPDESVALAALYAEGVSFTWGEVDGAENYRLLIESKAEGPASKPIRAEKEVGVGQFRVTKIPSGLYTWKVQAIGTMNRVSEWSPARQFRVRDIEPLTWLDVEGNSIFYDGEKPQLAIKWAKGPAATTQWRFRHVTGETAMDSAPWKKTLGPMASVILPKDGVWRFQAQALNGKENVLAETPVRTIRFLPSPPLAAPVIAAGSDGVIKARGDGSVTIKWEPVKGATKYIVLLKSVKSDKVKKIESKGTSVSFDNLDPGQYRIQARTVNLRSEPGPEGEARVIAVPEESELKAPKMKKIHIK